MISIKQKYSKILLIGTLISLIIWQFIVISNQTKVIDIHELNSIAAYKHMLQLTDFELLSQKIEEVAELDHLDMDTYADLTLLSVKTFDHLILLNLMRGYSFNDKKVLNNTKFITNNYSYAILYEEQYEYHNLIGNTLSDLLKFLRLIQNEGIGLEERTLLNEIASNIRVLEKELKSIHEQYLEPESEKHLVRRFNTVKTPLINIRDGISTF